MKNEKKKQKQIKHSLLMLTATALLANCTKEIPYQQAAPDSKEHVYGVGLFDEKSEYLYSASMQNGSRSSSDALPFSSGDNKRVKLQLTEDSLRIIETERDARYASNTTNNKLILEIPIEHVQFQCAKDKYGECTNTEENATNIPWQQRNQVKVKLADVKSGELDLLPIMVSQTEGENCYENVSTKLKSSEITDEAINFQIERTFKTKLDCLTSSNLSDAIVTANYHYSLVKVDSVLSKGFKTLAYENGSDDEQTFGFFSTQKTQLDVDNNDTVQSNVQIMNHWNPNRPELTYYLSDEFSKPENKMIKDLTYQTVDNINDGLAEAGVQFRIKLHEPAGKVPGDIRNSMIVLVEDPVESNIIGYGPQTEDPVTGEIISARTVMFLGTIKKFIKYTYDEILREKKSAQSQSTQASSSSSVSESTDLAQHIASLKLSGQTAGLSGLDSKVDQLLKDVSVQTPTTVSATSSVSSQGSQTLSAATIAEMGKSLKNYTKAVNPEIVGTDLKSRLRYLHTAKNCAYAPTMEAASSGISPKLMAAFNADNKPWEELSDSEKNKVIAVILPEIWVPTLIHEMGHNLGLRHNFAASEDKDNFFNAKELAARKIDHPIPFSSVMDYGNDLKTLSHLGKYDIAALRYAYVRKVKVQDSQGAISEINVDTSLEKMKPQLAKNQQELKKYDYCTDEHLGLNAGCKQFDLGTSYTEIVQNYIKDYEDGYDKRNFRNGRASFSLMDDVAYARRIRGLFNELRLMMEVRESYKYRFFLTDDSQFWEKIPFLNDLNKASALAGSFLAKVILTPDLTCLTASSSNPNTITGIANLNQISGQTLQQFMSCDDLQTFIDKNQDDPDFKGKTVVGHFGKFLNSKKDPNNKNSYMDQIDIRGIWMDKLIAAETLMRRQIGIPSLDKNTDNFMNLSIMRDDLNQVLNALMNNNVVTPVTVTMNSGEQIQLELPVELFDTQVIEEPLVISQIKKMPAPSDFVNQMLQLYANRLGGINLSGPTSLQQAIARRMSDSLIDSTGAHEEDRSLALSMRINRYALSDRSVDTKARVYVYGNTQYVADKTNTLALSIIDNLAVTNILDKVPADQLDAVLKSKKDKKPLAKPATAEQKEALRLSVDKIQAYVDGTIKNTDFYTRLLQILP